MGQVLAAVDIGSNTVHLLVAGVSRNRLKRIRNESAWLGLGQVVAREKSIPAPVIDKLIASLSGFRDVARSEGATALYLFATEAIRAAQNQAELVSRIKKSLKIQATLITGVREAELGMRGALIDCPGPKPLIFAEVGGGSAQLARFDSHGMEKEMSLPIGTGRITALTGLQFPPTHSMVEHIQFEVARGIDQCEGFGAVKRILASGGVARGLIRALHPDGERELHKRELDYLIWSTERLSIPQISQRFNVRPRRAETLMVGAILFRQILSHFGHNEMMVSDFGVREGAILEMAEGKIVGCPT